MRNVSIRTKILTGILTGGIYLSSVSTTFAVTASPINVNEKTTLTNEYKQIDAKIYQNINTNSEDLVTAKTITESQANKIKTVLNKSIASKKESPNFTKAITSVKDKKYKNSNKINYINPLTTLVDNGTITEIQAEKILMKQLYLYHAKMLKSSL